MADPVVAYELTSIVDGSPSEASQIAHLIPSIVEDKPSAREILLRLLKDPETKQIHFVMDGLKALGPMSKDEEIVTLVLDQIERRGELFRERIIGALIANYSDDTRVREIAKDELHNRRWTVGVVASAYPNDEAMASQIFDMASPLPIELRLCIVSDKSILSNDPGFALELLSKWDQDIDEEVKTEGSIRYHTAERTLQNGVVTDTEKLRQTLQALGPDFEQRRLAAFAGCIALNCLDLLLEIKEAEGAFQGLLTFGFRQNTVLLRYILEHWTLLKEKLGQEFWRYFKGFDSTPLGIWSKFAVFLSEYDTPREEALEFLSTRSERNSTTEVLRFLSKVASHRWLLLDYLLEAVCPTKTREHEPRQTVIAAEMLGECFASDAEVLAQLEQRFNQEPPEWYTAKKDHIVIALCEGWADSQVLHRVFQEVRGTTLLPPITAWNVVCVKSAAETVAAELKALFLRLAHPNPYWDPHFARPVIRRLRRDPDLFKTLESGLEHRPTSTEKATVVKLLAAAKGISAVLKNWITAEIERQLDRATSPEIGLDLSVGELRPVVHCLLETLLFPHLGRQSQTS